MAPRTGNRALPALLAALAMSSCVPLQPYHKVSPGAGESAICTAVQPGDCATAAIEEHEEYLLGFVEFDDLGWAWDRGQQDLVLARIEREAKERDVLMVVFAHGWKHDARSCDTNVTCFRDTLKQLYRTEEALAGEEGSPRRIVGVYIGWRGRSSDGKLTKQLTFYGRKATAHKVGSGAVTELLVRLKEIRNQRHRKVEAMMESRFPDLEKADLPSSPTRLVFVGHSFGGALMYSATSQLLVERLALSAAYGDAVRGFGDLVVLVNPAFEAALYEPLYEAVRHGSYPADQRPILAIITSQGDKATGKAFPIGRWLPAKFEDYRQDEKKQEQIQAYRKAVGHFPLYRTHFLNPNANTPEPVAANKKLAEGCGCNFPIGDENADAERVSSVQGTMDRLQGYEWSDAAAELEFPLSTLVRAETDLPPNSPILVISTDPKIIRKHSDIYQRSFIDFLRYVIMLAGEPVDYTAVAGGDE